jgi:ribosomal protein S14
MTSRAGSWMITAGALAGFCGLCVLPAALLGEHRDVTLLGLGACLLSLGALSTASGIYWKARLLQSHIPTGTADGESKSRRVRGGCQLCGTETPVIQCRVHQLQLCPICLAEHYDFRSCAYVPTTRRPTNKSGKGMAAKRGA